MLVHLKPRHLRMETLATDRGATNREEEKGSSNLRGTGSRTMRIRRGIETLFEYSRGYTSNKQTVADKLGQVAGEEAAAWDALMKKPLKDQEGMETSRREKRKRDMCLDLVAAACAARDANSNPG
ncbi:hypothetical protein GQ600_18236 [Phytophthora cactorum]|nr:hypothetical protein GQ600_18236 [Phytophthora cactorum]